MAIATRMAQTTWEGPLASGTGLIRMSSGAVVGEPSGPSSQRDILSSA